MKMKKFIVTFLSLSFMLLIHFIEADKPKIFVDNQHKLTITCLETEDCTKQLGIGYNCTNHACMCDNEETCDNKVLTPKTSAIVNVIDEKCTKDDLCKVKDSLCSDGYCRCIGGKVASDNKRTCLPISGGLNETCIEDMQCISSEPNSICRENKCTCNDIHNQDKFSCVRKIGLGGKCNSNVQCSHIPASLCGPIYCECENGFISSENKDECLPIAKTREDICEENVQCKQLYGQIGVCKKNTCDCDAAHHLSIDEYNLSCPSKLKTFCDNDDDCKMSKDDFSMYCLRDRCECSPLFEEIDGTCNGALIYKPYNLLFISWLMLLLLNK